MSYKEIICFFKGHIPKTWRITDPTDNVIIEVVQTCERCNNVIFRKLISRNPDIIYLLPSGPLRGRSKEK